MARVLPGKNVFRGKEAQEVQKALDRSLRTGTAAKQMQTASTMTFPVKDKKTR